MEKGIIAWARWIKPISRRSPTQTCCHAIFSLKSPQAANSILTHGMVVHQKKVYAEKCKKEPLRCLKCHGWGQMARECSAAVDTCGMCTVTLNGHMHQCSQVALCLMQYRWARELGPGLPHISA